MIDTIRLSRPLRGRRSRSHVLPVVGFIVLGALLFPSAGWDDAYITYWSAHSLSDLGRIANYNHEFVEQSSSLGFVLVIALVRRITGVDASIVGRLLSVAFGALTIVATTWLARGCGTGVARATAALLGSATFFIYWSFGGMEATLAACAGVLLLLLITWALEEGMGPGWTVLTVSVAAVYLLSRPESLFILAATLAGVAVVQLVRGTLGWAQEAWEARVPRVLAVVAALSLGGGAALGVFRLWYFGLLFPQPVYAKSTGLRLSKVIDGLRYVLDSFKSDFLFVALVTGIATVGVLVSRPSTRARTSGEAVCAVFVLASLSFIVLSGGDGMHGGRFFVPMIPAAMILCAALLSKSLSPRMFRVVVVTWVTIQVGGAIAFARTQSHSDPLWAAAEAGPDGSRFNWFERANHDHRRYFSAVVALEAQVDQVMGRKTPVTILSGQSGFVMYHVAKSHPNGFMYLDRFGLATRDFSACRVSGGAKRSKWGLLITIEDYLQRRDAFQQRCGLAPPDIIYEIFGGEFPKALGDALTTAGYRIVYLQDHDVTGGSRLFPGRKVARVYIATLGGPAVGARKTAPDSRATIR